MNVLDEARAAYAGGRLVPFLGSGMSRPVCRDWAGMVDALERLPGAAPPEAAAGTGDLANANRAARAIERRWLGRGIPAADSVRDALLEDGSARPAAEHDGGRGAQLAAGPDD